MTKIPDKIYSIGINVLKVIAIIIFAFLFINCFISSYDVLPTGNEIVIKSNDNLLVNILCICLFFALFFILYKVKSAKIGKHSVLLRNIFLGITETIIVIEGLWWVLAVNHAPISDPYYISTYASYMSQGIYDFMGKTGYFGMYPHQLGLAFFEELYYMVVGPMRYSGLQILNVLFVAGIVYLGHCIVTSFSKNIITSYLYCIFMLLCSPLVIYTQWIYGEIGSIFFILAAVLFLMRCSERLTVGNMSVVIISTVLACLIRKNSMIFVVALVIVFIMMFLKDRKPAWLISAVIVVALPLLVYEGIFLRYERLSGEELSNGFPTLTWVAMGMGENPELGPGGYNNIVVAYGNADYDMEKLKAQLYADMSERLEYFAHNPGYAVDFFARKLLYQWNQPMYQSMFFSSRFMPGTEPTNEFFNELCFGSGYAVLFSVANVLQLLVFLGMLLFCIFCVDRKQNVLQYALLICIVGGFIFSLIWEAKGRYIFPYYIMMFPMSVIGYDSLIIKILENVQHRKSKI